MPDTFTHNDVAQAVARDTGWDLDAYAADRGWAGVNLGPVGQHRDSDVLDESNFQYVIDRLNAIDPEVSRYDVVRFRHWAVGWVEEIATRADDVEIARELDEIRGRLESYPILDEEDYSRREWERDHPSTGECYSDYCRQDGRCSVSGRFVSTR